MLGSLPRNIEGEKSRDGGWGAYSEQAPTERARKMVCGAVACMLTAGFIGANGEDNAAGLMLKKNEVLVVGAVDSV